MRRTGGFTLIEIIISLAILAVGSVAVLGLYVQNLRLAGVARREVVLAIMEKDIAAKNQLAAFRANSQYGMDFAGPAWLIKDYKAYNEFIDPNQRDCPGAALYWPGPDVDEADSMEIYKGYYFAAYTLRRQGITFADSRATHGLYLYDNQFVDYDGYGWIDLNWDGVEDMDEDFGDPAPSHFVKYDSRKMEQYMKRIECVVVWDWPRNPDELFTRVASGWDIGHNYQKFRFMVYNPDLGKF